MELYRKAPRALQTRWASFENPTAGKGAAARTNRGAKGAAFGWIEAGEAKTLLDIEGSGLITRFWLTIDRRTPETLRALRLDIFWDGSAMPAVSCPLGDFFAVSLGAVAAFESEFFIAPEGRSWICAVPMPFRRAARMTLTNESAEQLGHLFYDVNVLLGVEHGDDALYFHTHWRRERPNALGEPLTILPAVRGAGRFLGASLGVICDPIYGNAWWGEGEFKAWLDGDKAHPTLCGTGAEDYLGSAWGVGAFAMRHHGCPVADAKRRLYSFYRFHVADPIYFHEEFRAALDTIGGAPKNEVLRLREAGAPLIPITMDLGKGRFSRFFDENRTLDDEDLPGDKWCNFWRCDDWSATAYFYLDRPENGLPPLAPVEERLAALPPLNSD